MSILDPDTLMPKINPGLWDYVQRRALLYGESYRGKRLDMIAEGWTFVDPINEAAAQADLEAWGVWEEGGADVDHYFFFIFGTDTFSRVGVDEPERISLLWSWIGPGGGVRLDYDVWADVIHQPIFLLFSRNKFYLGMVSRDCNRMAQILVAQCLEICLGLDNRGRPRI